MLEAQWQAFMDVATGCEDFERVAAAHEKCLLALHAQCFLQQGAVSRALHQLFQLCLALCRMLSYAPELCMHSPLAPMALTLTLHACRYADAGERSAHKYKRQFDGIRAEFGRQSSFLFAFLSNMASPAASPHLSQLLLRLNFNEFFVANSLSAGAERDVGEGVM